MNLSQHPRAAISMALITILTALLLRPGLAQEDAKATCRELIDRSRTAMDEMRFSDALLSLDRAITQAADLEARRRERMEAHGLRALVREQLRDLPGALKDSELVIGLHELILADREHPDLVADLVAHGRLLALAGAHERAIETYSRALTISRTKQPKDLAQRLPILHALAAAQRRIKDHAAAIITLRAQIQAIESLQGELHSDTSQPLWDLALCHRLSGAPAEAIPVLDRWIAVFEKVKGEADPSTARGVAAIADCLLALGRLDEAEKTCLRWLKLLEKVSRKHPDLVLVLERLARIERDRGNTSFEIAHLEEAVERGQALPQPDPVRDAGLLVLLARARRSDGRIEAARKAIDEAMVIFAESLPSSDPQPLLARIERGRVAETEKNLAAAEADYRAVLEAFEKMAGSKHPALLEPLRALAALARKVNDLKTAEAYEARIKLIEN